MKSVVDIIGHYSYEIVNEIDKIMQHEGFKLSRFDYTDNIDGKIFHVSDFADLWYEGAEKW